jgi:hypothetical protein
MGYSSLLILYFDPKKKVYLQTKTESHRDDQIESLK